MIKVVKGSRTGTFLHRKSMRAKKLPKGFHINSLKFTLIHLNAYPRFDMIIVWKEGPCSAGAFHMPFCQPHGKTVPVYSGQFLLSSTPANDMIILSKEGPCAAGTSLYPGILFRKGRCWFLRCACPVSVPYAFVLVCHYKKGQGKSWGCGQNLDRE